MLVEKGQTVVIQNQSLFISDTDSRAENLIIRVEQVPRHGENLVLLFINKDDMLLLY